MTLMLQSLLQTPSLPEIAPQQMEAALGPIDCSQLSSFGGQLTARSRLIEREAMLQHWAVALACEVNRQHAAREALQRDQEEVWHPFAASCALCTKRTRGLCANLKTGETIVCRSLCKGTSKPFVGAMKAAAQLRQARAMGAAQEELGRQQQELAGEQEAFAVQRSSVVASFNANAQQRIADLEVRLGHLQHHLHLDVLDSIHHIPWPLDVSAAAADRPGKQP